MTQEETIRDMVVALYSFSIELKSRIERINFDRSKSWFGQKDSAGIKSANEMLRKAKRQNRMISRRFFWTPWSFRASKEEKQHAKEILEYTAKISAALKSMNLYADPRSNSKYTTILVHLCQDLERMFGSNDLQGLEAQHRTFRKTIGYLIANPYSGRQEFRVQNPTGASDEYSCSNCHGTTAYLAGERDFFFASAESRLSSDGPFYVSNSDMAALLRERYKETSNPSAGDVISFPEESIYKKDIILQHTGTIVKVANDITFFHQENYGSPFSVTTLSEYKKKHPSFEVHYHKHK